MSLRAASVAWGVLILGLALPQIAAAQTVTINPNGEGTDTGGTYVLGSLNYTNLQQPDDDALSYLSFGADLETRTVTLTNPGTGVSNSITSVQVNFRAIRGIGDENAAAVIRIGGSINVGATKTLTGSWANYSETWTSNPFTSEPWTWANIDSLEAGVRAIKTNPWSSGNQVWITSVWVVVTYAAGKAVVLNDSGDRQGFATLQDAEDYVTTNAENPFTQDWIVEARDAGPFNETVQINGNNPAAAKRLIFRAQSGVVPVIDGQNTRATGFDIRDDYVKIDGFKLQNFATSTTSYGSGIQIDGNSNIEIAYCTIDAQADFCIMLGFRANGEQVSLPCNDVLIHHNVLANAIHEEGNPNWGDAIHIMSGCLRTQIYNNVFYAFESDGIFFMSDSPDSTGTVIRNNIFYPTVAGSTCINVADGDAQVGLTSDHNVFFLSNVSSNAGYWGSTRATLASWQSASGQDANSIDADPLAQSAATLDFHPKSSFGRRSGGSWALDAADSPTIDRGSTLSATLTAAVSAGDSTITVSSTTGFPSQGVLYIESDEIFYTGTTATTFTGCTSVSAHANGLKAYAGFSYFGLEAGDNGGRINVGNYGGTADASRSGDPDYGTTWTGWSKLRTGTANANWSDANNWSNGVPTSSTSVLVPDRSGVDQDGATVGTQAGSQPTLNAAGSALSVYVGDTANTYDGGSPTAIFEMTSATDYTLTVSGTSAAPGAPSGAVFYVSSTGEFRIASGTLLLSAATAANSIENDGTVRVSAAGTGNATIDGPFRTDTTTAGKGLQIDGAFTLAFRKDFRRNSTTAVVDVDPNGVFKCAGSSDQTLDFQGATIEKLAIAKTSGSATVTSAVTANGTTDVTGGILSFDTGASSTLTGAITVDGSNAELLLTNTATVNVGTSLTVGPTSGSKLRSSATSSPRPLLTKASGTWSLSITGSGTYDLSGLSIDRLDAGGFQIASTVPMPASGVNEVEFQSNCLYGFNIAVTSGTYTFRGCVYGMTSGTNVKIPASGTIRVVNENASGGRSGESYDDDPYESTSPPDGYVTWVTFDWKYVGGGGNNNWSNVSNWEYRGSPATDYPNSSTAKVYVSTGTAVLDAAQTTYSVADLSIAAAATLDANGKTLEIWGSAFKSSSGTFTHGNGLVKFRGGAAQVLVYLGGGGGFYRLEIDKTSGTSVTLGSNVTVADNLTLTSGTLDLGSYRLTHSGGTLTVAASGTLQASHVSAVLDCSVGLSNSGTIALTAGTLQFTAASVALNGTINVSGGALVTSGTNPTRSSGTFTLSGTGTWKIASNFEQTGGTFKATSTSAAVTTTNTGTPVYFGFKFSGGTVDVSGLSVSYLNTSGAEFTNVDVSAGTQITAFNNVLFSNTQTNGSAFVIQVTLRNPHSEWTKTFSGLSFPPTVDKCVKITDPTDSAATADVLTMSLYSPSSASGSHTEDSTPANDARVVWNTVKVWAGNWRYRREIGSELTTNETSGETVCVQIDTKTNVAWSTIRDSATSADDLRVVYFDASAASGNQYSELSRQIVLDHSTFSSSLMCQIYFQMPVTFAAGDKVYLYYGNPNPASPTSASLRTASFSDNFESGSLSSWTSDNEASISTSANWQQTNGVRLTGGGATDNYVYKSGQSGATVAEAWIKTSDVTAASYFGLRLATSGGTTLARLGIQSSKIQYWDGAWKDLSPSVSASNNTWYHVRIDYDNATDTFVPYVDGNRGIAGTASYAAAGDVDTVWVYDFRNSGTITNDADNVYIYGATIAATLNSIGATQETITSLWTDPFNWSPPSAPATSHEVLIDYDRTSFQYGPTLNAAATVQGLKIVSVGSTAGVNDAFVIDATAYPGATLDISTGGFTMTGGKADWKNGSAVSSTGDVSVTTSAASGFAPTATGNTFTMKGSAARKILLGGDSANTFGTLTLTNDGGSDRTITLDSDLKVRVLNVGASSGMTADVTLDVNGRTVTVSDASASALTIRGTSSSFQGILLLDAAADLVKVPSGGATVAANGLVTMSAGTIEVATAWDDSAAGGGMIPTGGTLKVTGVATLKRRSVATANSLHHLTIASTGAVTIAAADANSDGTIRVNGTLVISSGRLEAGAGQGIVMGSGGTIDVDGELRLLGASGSNASVTAASGTYSMTVDGTIWFRYFTFTGLNDSGVVFGASATITEMNDGTFNIGGTGPALDFSALTTGATRRVPYSFVEITFAKGSPSPTDRNVKSSSTSPVFWFQGSAADNGSMWGATYENDPNGRIEWVSDVVERLLDLTGTVSVTSGSAVVTGSGTSWASTLAAGNKFRVAGETNEYAISTVDSNTQITLTTAYRGATAAGKRYEGYSATTWATLHRAVAAGPNDGQYRYRPSVATSESFDVQVSKSAATDLRLRNVKWYRLTGSCALDSDGGTARRLKLYNCIVGRGDLSEADLYNVTVFDPTGGVPAVTDCGAMNSIFEGTPTLADINGADPDANLTGVSASLFIGADQLDFHLKSTAASAIDQGSTPSDWSADVDGQVRPYNGTFDIGADEYWGTTVTPRALTDPLDGGAVAKLGTITRFQILGTRRGSASGYVFSYLLTGGGGGTNSNTFLVVRSNASVFEIAARYQTPAPVLNYAFQIDNNTADSTWRAWIFLVLDAYVESSGAKGQDGIGDSIFCLVDKGDSGLVHPTAAVGAADVTTRRFGSDDYYGDGTVYLYRPSYSGVDYRIHWPMLSTVNPDGTADADGNGNDTDDPVYNSPSGTKRARWLRLFFAAYKTTATAGGALVKVNADPYDKDSVQTPDNQAFGETMWSILPGGSNPKFEYRALPTFTWASGFQEIFVPVSENASPAQTLLTRYAMAGTTAPSISRDWQGTEEAASVDENRFGVVLDNGGAGAVCVYGPSDGTVVYARTVDSASGSGHLRWAGKLKDAGGTAVSPVCQPLRFWPTAFAVVGYDGGVQKFWAQDGTMTHLAAATIGGEGTITVDSTTGFASSGTVYVGDTAVTYTGTTATTFTGCSGVGAHPSGAPVVPSSLRKNGCLVSDGKKLELGTAAAGDETAEIAGAKDPDWPIQCVGKPVSKVWMSGAKIYWGTDRGYVYGWNIDNSGASVAGGDETAIVGYPYILPGAKVMWIYVHPLTKVIVATDTGTLYQFEP